MSPRAYRDATGEWAWEQEPYRGGGRADNPDQEFPFVVLRREYGYEPPDWFAWWFAFTMQDSCIAENEL